MRGFWQLPNQLVNPIFVATVEDNKDPTYNCRVRVRITNIHDKNITTNQLPWAAKLDSSFLGGSGSYIDHSIPEIGTTVAILAVGNDLNSLLYLGKIYKKEDVCPTNDQYTGSFGLYSSEGQFIGIDKINKVLKMLYCGDILVDKADNLTINIKNNVKITCQNAEINATQTTINSTTTINGATTINGTLDVSQDITSQANVKANGGEVTLPGHTHTFVQAPAGQGVTDPGKG